MPTKLGQNFLVNNEIVKRIIESADLQPDDLVLEIGPGKGILTEELAKKSGKVIAVEIDKVLSNMLRNKFSNNKNVEIIEGDILKIPNFQFLISKQVPVPNDLISKKFNDSELKHLKLIENLKFKIENCNYKVIANIPYYITAPIIRKFLEIDCPPTEMILMVQKEVAERICASIGKMSILSVSVQYYAEPKILFSVPRENFDPAPEVDSAVIRIEARSKKKETSKEDINKFFRVVRAGFSAKRKTLLNNLSNSFHLDKKATEEKLKAVGIKPTARAQELSIEDWKKLARKL